MAEVVGGTGWWWLKRKRSVARFVPMFPNWQGPKRYYVHVDSFARKCCCGEVDCITQKIPMVWGSISGYAICFFALLFTTKSKVIYILN